MSQYRQLVHVSIQAIGACRNIGNWFMSQYRQLVHVEIQAIGACRNTGNWCMSQYRQLVHVEIQAIGACLNVMHHSGVLSVRCQAMSMSFGLFLINIHPPRI